MVKILILLPALLFIPLEVKNIEVKALFVNKYCLPCKKAEKLVPSDTKIIDIHKYPNITRHYKIKSTPTYIIIKNRYVTLKLVGLTEIQEYFERQHVQSSSYIILPEIIQPDTNLLFTIKHYPPCKEAEKLVSKDTKIVDMYKNPILANRYKIIAVPTYLIIKSNQVILKLVGLNEIKDYCNRYSQETFSGVIYFDGPDNQLTSGIKRRIKRFGYTIKNGNKQDASDYKITHLPTFIFIENGKEIGRYVGVNPLI